MSLRSRVAHGPGDRSCSLGPSWQSYSACVRALMALCHAVERPFSPAGFWRWGTVLGHPGWRDRDGRPSCMLGWRGGNAAGEIRSVPRPAPLAQSAERLHGKEKVYGSIP